jgi:serine protease Do
VSRAVAALSFAFVAGVSALVGAVVGGSARLTPPPAPGAGDPPFAAAAGPSALGSFAEIVARVNASVVHIEVLDPNANPHAEVEGAPPIEVPQRGEGSGFVIDPLGYIVTNHHVVSGAERIRVHLADKRDVPAELVGTDQATDVALIRIDALPGLRAAALGDSDRLRVGDWVCAIGNPLGFDHSATVGVVSSKGRKIWDVSFDAYIQTDAAINPGNSGGPLLDAAGRVVGINAAVSREGQGIGFAIPINVAREVLAQLRARGQVTRGYLGVQLGELDPDYQRLLNLPDTRGALVVDLLAGQAGEAAGLRRYDVIRSVGSRAVASGDELVHTVALTPPGSDVALLVLRDGRELTLRARLSERAPALDAEPAPQPPSEASPEPEERGDALGLRVSALAPQARRKRQIPAERAGVVVEDVLGWAAESDALEPGDVIVEVDRQPTPDVAAYERALGRLAPGSKAVLFVYRPDPGTSFMAKLEVERP